MDTQTEKKSGATEASKDERGGRVFRGKVVSAKMKDTITVAVERYVKHPKYKKYMRRTKKYLVHDEGNTKEEGSTVSIQEIAPISKKKRFRVLK